MSDLKVHLDGRLVPASQATVGVGDAGLVHGASVFTTMRVHRGQVFRLDRHLARLLETAEHFALRTDATPDSLTAATAELLRANGLAEGRARITLTPGPADGAGPCTTLITADPLPPQPQEWYQRGINVVVSSYKQGRDDALAGYKTGCYLPRLLARRDAAAKGAEEALWFTSDNLLAEGCFCNVFLVVGGRVLTPPLDTPVLPGIVRGAVLELCAAGGIECDDTRPLTVRDLLAAEELFLTSAVSGIRPVVRVERHSVGEDRPGAVTRRLMEAYAELLDRECPRENAQC
ncbi:MAG: aminotransferase class IV [Phycisphaerae bacterium]|nr:aminotransferase class IV [Phycisphaerae bacterium]